jgi:2-polyprenyl-3-methyl-5-hydroxy-6-metoxy-1,4-benzoquinol methylase
VITNPIYKEFIQLGLINKETVDKISDRTRDKDIPVFIDNESKIIFLGRYDTSDEYYEQTASGPIDDPYFKKNGYYEDDLRRFEQFKTIIKKKNIMDFGCEWGGFLKLAEKEVQSACGVELNINCRSYIQNNLNKIETYDSIKNTKTKFDIITVFHCLEHIPHQQKILRELKTALKKGGLLIVEVPHAKDFLIQSINLPSFREFTFWSEHLVLHTKQSLKKLLSLTGYKNITIDFFQRFGYTNHLGWILDGKPGGHQRYKDLENTQLEESYKSARSEEKVSDTIIAYAYNT